MYTQKITTVFKENGGQGSTFNAGYAVAKGDIITFLDSDDYFYPTKLEKIVVEHERGIDIVEHATDCTGGFCRWTQTKEEAQEKLKIIGSLIRFAETSALSFSRNILEKVFPIPEERTKICTETYILIEALYHTNKISTIREALSFYRIHDSNNYTNNKNNDKYHYHKFKLLFNKKLKNENMYLIPFNPIFKLNVFLSNLQNLDLDSSCKYAIYGLGNAGSLVEYYLDLNDLKPSFYIDSNENKRDLANNLYHFSDLPNIKDKFDFIIIASSYHGEITKVLLNQNIEAEKIINLW